MSFNLSHRINIFIVLSGLLTAYLFASFPRSPSAPVIHNSLAHLPSSSPSWNIYPEDFYTGGAYANFPLGRARILVDMYPCSHADAISRRCDIGS